MSIGIIGSGALGSNVARALAARGMAATITNRSGPASLGSLIHGLGPSITAGTVKEAAAADIFPVDLGPLDVGGPLMQVPFGSLASVNFITI